MATTPCDEGFWPAPRWYFSLEFIAGLGAVAGMTGDSPHLPSNEKRRQADERAIATIEPRSARHFPEPQTGSIAGVDSGSQASAGSRFSWRITSTEQVAWRTIAVAFEPMR